MYDVLYIVVYISFILSISSLIISIAMMYINLIEEMKCTLADLNFFNRLCCFFVLIETNPNAFSLKGLKYKSIFLFSSVIALFSASSIVVFSN